MVRAPSRPEDRGVRNSSSRPEHPDDRDGHQPAAPAHDRSMTVRNFVEKTQNDYIRHVKNLTAFLGRSPDGTVNLMECGRNDARDQARGH